MRARGTDGCCVCKRHLDAVALGKHQHLLRLQCALYVQVQLGFGQARYEVLQLLRPLLQAGGGGELQLWVAAVSPAPAPP